MTRPMTIVPVGSRTSRGRLTAGQAAILAHVESVIGSGGRPMSLREVGAATRIPYKTLHAAVGRLADLGYIRLATPGRGIKVEVGLWSR